MGKIVEFDLSHASPEVWADPLPVLRPWLVSERSEQGWHEMHCPLHDDANPSAVFNAYSGWWHCFSGCGHGPVHCLLRRINEGETSTAPGVGRLSKPKKAEPLPSPGMIAGWHSRLVNHPEARAGREYLHARGITEEVWEQFELGYDDEGRITIPVYEDGALVNLRTRYPRDRAKVIGLTGQTTRTLYPSAEHLPDEGPAFIVEGELDALLLWSYGYAAFTCNGGADMLPKVVADHAHLFAGRDVMVWTDWDDAGEKARDGVTEALADAATVVILGAEGQAEGADVTDAWRQHGEVFREWLDGRLAEAFRADGDASGTGPMRRLTDLGNAERLVDQHGDDLRYCPPWRKWLVWDGLRWRPDTDGEAERRAKATVRTIAREAEGVADSERFKAILKHASRSEGVPRIRAMLEAARVESGIPAQPDELDAYPWLFNVANGTLDLRVGRIRAPRRVDMMTKTGPVAYEPDAACPRWDRFMEDILPDPEDRDFVQKAVGYSLTGRADEQVAFLMWGSGANGKSTFIETISRLIGPGYARQASSELLLAKNPGNHPSDVAALQGARFISTVETDEGRRLSEALFKQLTGGDRVAARRMYGDWFEFTMQGKLWLATNSKPQVHGTNDAVWRRIRLIPFTVRIPEDRRDAALKDKLWDEAPGILRWAVEGCLRWQREGLKPTANIVAATDEYRTEQDLFGDFLDEYCVVEDGAETTTDALYNAYVSWASANSLRVLSKNMLSRKLGDRGFEHTRTVSGRVARGYRGVRLKNRNDGETVKKTGLA